MRKIAELTTLLRGRVELPDNLTPATEEFLEGWTFMQSEDTHWLDTELRTRGWNLMWIGEGLIRSGVGQTSQDAIASALKLALRRVNERCHAVEVETIQLTMYPWFALAKVEIYPYQIQKGSVLSSLELTVPVPLIFPAKAVAIPRNRVAPAVQQADSPFREQKRAILLSYPNVSLQE